MAANDSTSEDISMVSEKSPTPSRCTCREDIDAKKANLKLGCEHEACCYKYLTRDTFTSEAFKIQLKNLHPYTGFKQLKKLLDSLKVKYRKVKLLKGITFLTFCSLEDRDDAIAILDGYVWKGRAFIVRKALAQADPLLQKRQLDTAAEACANGAEAAAEVPTKRANIAPELNTRDDEKKVGTEEIDCDPLHRLLDTVSPLWRLPYYPDQINVKRQSVVSTLVEIRRKLIECNPRLASCFPNDASTSVCENVDTKDLPTACPLLQVIQSPVVTGYRNKSELTIGCDIDGQGPFIGFRFSKYRDGITAVGPLTEENNLLIPNHSTLVLTSLQRFLTECSSDLQVTTYDPIKHHGHWRQVLVRESKRSGDLLLLVDLHPQQLTQTELDSVGERLRGWFSTDGPGECTHVTSLYMATRRSTSEKFDASNTRLLLGKKYIIEQCCGLKFRISIDAFFQINTLAAELLYKEVLRFATEPPSSLLGRPTSVPDPAPLLREDNEPENKCLTPPSDGTLLDVCCGTGTIGLCLAKHFRNVIGIEMVNSAVEDAKNNAADNGILNIDFYAGRAEDVIRDILKSIPGSDDLVAVVDPPRAGLHSTVIQALRRCDRLQRIVYVSCNLQGAVHNLVDFARPTSKRFLGLPFIPVLATAVDLFPQTKHVETVLLLQRAAIES